MMTQIIYKDKIVYCRTTIPYPPNIIKSMKKAGYKVKEIADDDTAKEKVKK